MRPAHHAFAASLTALAAACHHAPAECSLGAQTITWFDGAGAPAIASRALADGTIYLCDGAGRLLARGKADPQRTELVPPGGRPVVATFRQDDEPLLEGTATVRLHGESRGLVRLLDPKGVPVGAFQSDNVTGTVFDPGGTPQRTLEAAGGRYVVHARDGHVVGYVGGTTSGAAAAAFAVEALAPVERAALAIWIDRNSGSPPPMPLPAQ